MTCTHLVLLSSSNVQGVVLCLPRFQTPQSVVLITGPPQLSALWYCGARPLQIHPGGEGTATWGMIPRGCEDTVACSRILSQGFGGGGGTGFLGM